LLALKQMSLGWDIYRFVSATRKKTLSSKPKPLIAFYNGIDLDGWLAAVAVRNLDGWPVKGLPNRAGIGAR